MKNKLIHVAKYFKEGADRYLFLKEKDTFHFVWYDENGQETEITAPHIEEAIRLARQEWKDLGFRTLICGFRYTLPERDEHGMNALFHQMAASYESSNGTYFDQELGHNCTVQNASQEALSLWRRIKND